MTSATLPTMQPSAELVPPNPDSPINGEIVDVTAVSFAWQPVDGARNYTLQVAPDRQFARDVIELQTEGSTSVAVHNALSEIDRPYFWRVRAITGSGETRWSPYGRFVAGNDAQVDGFRAEQEAKATEERRRQAREDAQREAKLALIPYVERDDTIPSKGTAKGIGFAFIASFTLVLLAVLLATMV